MTPSQLVELKVMLKSLVAENKAEKAIHEVKQALPFSSPRFNLLIKLQQEQAAIAEMRWKNTEGPEHIARRHARLVENFLEFIDILEEVDFGIVEPSSKGNRKTKTGSVLYAIPGQMEVGKEKRCIVRLAFDEAFLAEFLKPDNDTHIESLRRIEEQMEVELLDPNEEEVFAIRTINSKMQIVEDDDYTEWIYYVKPQKEGVFELDLKVTVIIPEKGKKEIVLHEKVEVTTFATAETEIGVPLKQAGIIFLVGLPGGAAPGAETDSPGEISEQAAVTGAKKSFWGSMAGKVAAVVGGIAIVGGVFFMLPDRGNPSASSQDDLIEQEGEAVAQFTKQLILPPLANVNVYPSTFLIDPQRDTTLQLPSGTAFQIPANSIVDVNGLPVTSPVEIRIREIRDSKEIIAGGIPMRYFDEEGVENWMQTAGMFEILGFVDGKAVKLDENKPITVNFATEIEGPCDFWFFNSESGNWAREKAGVQTMENPNLLPQDEAEEEAEAPSLPSIQPVLGSAEKILPPFKIDYQYFPGLKQFRDLEWEYAGKDPSENPRNNPAFFDPWSNIIIEKGKNGTYQLSFTRANDTLVVPVKPCFRRERDLKAFEKNMSRYAQKQKAYQERVQKQLEKEAYREANYDFIRSVMVRQFGLYNYDYLIKLDDHVPLLSDFDFDGQLPDHLINEVAVYLITGDSRSVIAFPRNSWNRFSFSPSLDNQLVAILPGGRAAVFTRDDFEREKETLIKARNQPYRFKMKVLPGRITSLEDLEQAIG
ncbi:MAG: hypothetical protein H6560_17775 [Lewinellaceae bacterium]|nr:hypothetical protein [Lewinellaceae bacterium]